MKKFFNSFGGFLFLAVLAFVLLAIAKIFIWHEPLVISTAHSFFADFGAAYKIEIPVCQFSIGYDFLAAIVWAMLAYGFSKLKFLESHELIKLSLINNLAGTVSLANAFYLRALLFGLGTYLSLVITYFLAILALGILSILGDIIFPD